MPSRPRLRWPCNEHAPFRPFRVILVIEYNAINGTNEIIFVGFFRSLGWSPNHIRDVQFTVETLKSQGESRDRIYLKCPNDCCDELDKCEEESEKHRRTGLSDEPSDYPTPPPSDYPTYYNRINSDRFWWKNWSEIRRKQVNPVGLILGAFFREHVS